MSKVILQWRYTVHMTQLWDEELYSSRNILKQDNAVYTLFRHTTIVRGQCLRCSASYPGSKREYLTLLSWQVEHTASHEIYSPYKSLPWQVNFQEGRQGLITFNYPVILFHWRSITVFSETYLLFVCLYFYRKFTATTFKKSLNGKMIKIVSRFTGMFLVSRLSLQSTPNWL